MFWRPRGAAALAAEDDGSRPSRIVESAGRRAEQKASDPAPPPTITTRLVRDKVLRHGFEAPDLQLLLPVLIAMLAIGAVPATAAPTALSPAL
jgi:hypothetical protein